MLLLPCHLRLFIKRKRSWKPLAEALHMIDAVSKTILEGRDSYVDQAVQFKDCSARSVREMSGYSAAVLDNHSSTKASCPDCQ